MERQDGAALQPVRFDAKTWVRIPARVMPLQLAGPGDRTHIGVKQPLLQPFPKQTLVRGEAASGPVVRRELRASPFLRDMFLMP